MTAQPHHPRASYTFRRNGGVARALGETAGRTGALVARLARVGVPPLSGGPVGGVASRALSRREETTSEPRRSEIRLLASLVCVSRTGASPAPFCFI